MLILPGILCTSDEDICQQHVGLRILSCLWDMSQAEQLEEIQAHVMHCWPHFFFTASEVTTEGGIEMRLLLLLLLFFIQAFYRHYAT